MDRGVASFLDHARRVLDAGRADEAAGLERQAELLASGVAGGAAEERTAILTLRADRLTRQGDRAGALTAIRGALELATSPSEVYVLRLEEGRLRLATGDPDALRTAETLVADGLGGRIAPWPMARAYALLARARESVGDEPGARDAEAKGRDLIAGGPTPPAALVAALGGTPLRPDPRDVGGRGDAPGTGPGDRAPSPPRGEGAVARANRATHPPTPVDRAPGASPSGAAGSGAGREGSRVDASAPGGAGRGSDAPRTPSSIPATAGGTTGAPRPARPTGPPHETPAPSSRTVDESAFAAVLADLDALVGLEGVKREVRRTAQLLRMRALREAADLKVADVSLHLVFCGGPGTGKTTVARLFGRLYRALGLLGSDRVVEVDRSGLVAGYVGKTATLVNEVVDSALDGVLFVDEAYALSGGGPSDFGPEAIATLIKRMEDDRDRLAVICAGYTAEMETFLASNSGLASRFSETIVFADYGPGELLAILERFCAGSDYALDVPGREAASVVLAGWHARRDDTFANARTVRNLFDDLIAAQADRLLSAGSTPAAAEMRVLTADDVRVAAA